MEPSCLVYVLLHLASVEGQRTAQIDATRLTGVSHQVLMTVFDCGQTAGGSRGPEPASHAWWRGHVDCMLQYSGCLGHVLPSLLSNSTAARRDYRWQSRAGVCQALLTCSGRDDGSAQRSHSLALLLLGVDEVDERASGQAPAAHRCMSCGEPACLAGSYLRAAQVVRWHCACTHAPGLRQG